MQLLPDTNTLDAKKYGTTSLHGLGDDILGNIDMADVTRFDLMIVIGTQMAEFIVNSGGAFTKDLAVNNSDMLVTKSGDIATIRKQLSNPAWLDGFKA